MGTDKRKRQPNAPAPAERLIDSALLLNRLDNLAELHDLDQIGAGLPLGDPAAPDADQAPPAEARGRPGEADDAGSWRQGLPDNVIPLPTS